MPLYDYDCANCGHRFEVIHGVIAAGPGACPACAGGPVRKAISAPTIHFKGSGWAKKERRAAASSSATNTSDDAPSEGGTAKDATPAKDSTAAKDLTPATPATGAAAATPAATESSAAD